MIRQKATRNPNPFFILKTSPSGLALIKHFEGLYLKAYRCPAGVLTIGYGHTGLRHMDGTVKPGRRITEAQAELLLQHDLRAFEARVRLAIAPLGFVDQCQFDALVSFDFNTGKLADSTLLTRLLEGFPRAAAQEFLRWTKAGGKVLSGLQRRRRAERAMFLGELWDQWKSE